MTAAPIADTLTAAADLIEPEGAWTQDHMAVAADGDLVAVRSDLAVRFCAMGALRRVDPENEDAAGLLLKRAIRRSNIAKWNDAPDRTQAEVVAALRRAASIARTREGGGE